MNFEAWLQLGLFVSILAATARPLGVYLGKVFSGESTFMSPVLTRVERVIYRLARVDEGQSSDWRGYTFDLLFFTALSGVLTYVILRHQSLLPLNPQGFGDLSVDLALNTAISFVTNTNWQSYAGESTLSNFSQMVGLTLQNFLSAAVGLCAAIAILRGIRSREKSDLGNFWVDLVRSHLYVLIPMCFVYALFLISQGVVQTFQPALALTTLEGVSQHLALGPVASQVAIKMLGTNGGGFFNANAAHPFENPTALSNFIQMLSIFLIPSALVYLLGVWTRNLRHAWSVWGVMALLFVGGVVVSTSFEMRGNPVLTQSGCVSPINWEGKEVRFGVFSSTLFATITTDASCGAVNSMHDSFTPMGGLVPLVNMLLGEIVFGGVGAGLYGMLLYILLTVFIAGLLVGRTPEYMGKKIEAREIKLAMIALLIMAAGILGLSAWASLDPRGVGAIANTGPHGFTEIFYAYTSAVANNGSAFAGLSANSPFWNLSLAFAMLIGRFGVLIPMLALAGGLARKKAHPGSEGSFALHGPVFMALLVSVILIVGALTFFPALSLGPIAEHFDLAARKTY